jgi:hypothetical protein
LDRLTVVFVLSVMIACAGFAAAPWRGMQSSADEGYPDAIGVASVSASETGDGAQPGESRQGGTGSIDMAGGFNALAAH